MDSLVFYPPPLFLQIVAIFFFSIFFMLLVFDYLLIGDHELFLSGVLSFVRELIC